MIARLTGIPSLVSDNLIVDVAGVGYGLKISNKDKSLLKFNQSQSFFVYTYVKEDKLELYGFLERKNQHLFEMLLNISGIGPNTALAISELGASQITTAIQEADVKFFTQVPRVGKKQAQKIIIELKSKLGGLKELELGSITDPKQLQVVEALESLGFDQQDIYALLPDLDLKNSIEVLIKQSLQKLSKQ